MYYSKEIIHNLCDITVRLAEKHLQKLHPDKDIDIKWKLGSGMRCSAGPDKGQWIQNGDYWDSRLSEKFHITVGKKYIDRRLYGGQDGAATKFYEYKRVTPYYRGMVKEMVENNQCSDSGLYSYDELDTYGPLAAFFMIIHELGHVFHAAEGRMYDMYRKNNNAHGHDFIRNYRQVFDLIAPKFDKILELAIDNE